MKIRPTALILTIAVMAGLLGGSGCSRKITGDSNGTVKVELSFALSDDQAAQQADTYRLTITGIGIAYPIVQELVLSEGRLMGEVEVPAGPDRLFVIELFDETGRLIYSGRKVVDIEPEAEIELVINLYPRVPLIRLTPVYIQRPQGTEIALRIKVYNLVKLNRADICIVNQNLSGQFSIGADTALINPGLGTAVVMENVRPRYDSITFTVRHVLDQYYFVDDSGYAELATVFYRTFTYDALVDTFQFNPSVLFLRDDSGDTIPTDSVRAEGTTAELYQLPYRTVATWEMNDTTDVIIDRENNLNGRANGTTINEGYLGLARFFNGRDEYIEVPHDTLLDLTEALTISAWIKPDSMTSGGTIISKRDENGPINYQLTAAGPDNAGVYSLFFEFGEILQTYRVSVGDIRDNQWHHVAVSFEFGKPASILFVMDGQQRIGDWIMGDGLGSPPINEQPLQIGRSLTTTGVYYSGGIDALGLFDVALDYESILAVFYPTPR